MDKVGGDILQSVWDGRLIIIEHWQLFGAAVILALIVGGVGIWALKAHQVRNLRSTIDLLERQATSTKAADAAGQSGKSAASFELPERSLMLAQLAHRHGTVHIEHDGARGLAWAVKVSFEELFADAGWTVSVSDVGIGASIPSLALVCPVEGRSREYEQIANMLAAARYEFAEWSPEEAKAEMKVYFQRGELSPTSTRLVISGRPSRKPAA